MSPLIAFSRHHLNKDGSVSAESIEDSVAVGPGNELLLFSNRDKFDLIAIHDDSSESISDSPILMALLRAIYEQSFKKMLRNIPLILVGGLRAWKAKFGAEGLVRGSTVSSTDIQAASNNVLQTFGAPSLPNVVGPRPMPGTAPLAPSPSHPVVPLSGHFRTPAESSTSTILTSPLMESTNFARNGPLSPTLQDSNTYKMWVPPSTATPVPLDSIPISLRSVIVYQYISGSHS